MADGANAAGGASGDVVRTELAAGWRTALPASVAVIPLGLALGVLVVQSGLSWWWAPIIAAIVFAGSMEFLLVGLISVAAPLAQVAVSTVLVNFRHTFYALTFPLQRVRGLGWKAYSTFALTDEAFALTATRDSSTWSRTRIVSTQAFFHVCWVMSVTGGAVVGIFVPPQIVGLDFAVTALFTVLGIEAYKVKRSLPLPALALACALVAALISLEHMLVIAMALFVIGLIASYIFANRRGRRRRRV